VRQLLYTHGRELKRGTEVGLLGFDRERCRVEGYNPKTKKIAIKVSGGVAGGGDYTPPRMIVGTVTGPHHYSLDDVTSDEDFNIEVFFEYDTPRITNDES
jgi:hypothetical protein